jgi:hypothetical protein
MHYITIKRYKQQGIGGHFNLPYGTPIEKREDNLLYHNNRPVCVARSFNAHEYFARNNDGRGLERGKLTHAIIKKLGGMHRELTAEWKAVFDDDLANSYARQDSPDFWLWDDSFFNAPIEDLKYIASLVGIKEGDKCIA